MIFVCFCEGVCMLKRPVYTPNEGCFRQPYVNNLVANEAETHARLRIKHGRQWRKTMKLTNENGMLRYALEIIMFRWQEPQNLFSWTTLWNNNKFCVNFFAFRPSEQTKMRYFKEENQVSLSWQLALHQAQCCEPAIARMLFTTDVCRTICST